jgi:hypothetical protein
MNKKIVDDIIMWVEAISMMAVVMTLFAVAVVMIVGVINPSRASSPKQKDYILHSITADGTAFYLHMDEEEYQQWASENHIKIQKLKLGDK